MSLTKKIKAVAIDGPAGSGKSTISRAVASELDYLYIDTGAMYRALTLKAVREGVDLADQDALSALSDSFSVSLLPSETEECTISVIMDEEDVSERIRQPDITSKVKYIARVKNVRDNMVRIQRKMAIDSDGAVMEGRDITTVVLPDAEHKFYLDASFDKRVERRFEELKAKGRKVDRRSLSEDLQQRDHSDRTREVGPLRITNDARFLDTSEMTPGEVVKKVISIVRGGRA